MSIRSVFLLIFATLLGLLGALLWTMTQLAANQQAVAAAETRRYESYQLADELRQSSDDLTRMVRTYVVTGDESYREYFEEILRIRRGEALRPAGYDGIYWDFVTAAMKGSSYYKLPRILQWFSGNIGYHHIHHLNSRIPNYNLERCHRSHPMFSEVPPLTLWQSFKSLKFRLWDEEAMKLISFGELKKQLQQRAGSSHS